MPTMDATAKAALASDLARADFIWLDISGDPLRITTFGKDVTFSGTGDVDLDGFTFTAFDARALSISEVSNSENGSEPLTIELSGIVSLDPALLADIGNRALWQGRTVRTWFTVYSADGVTQQGAIVPEATAYMSSVDIMPSPKTQSIRLNAENYLAVFSGPSNRSYAGQKDYDSADISASATLAAANGAHHHGAGAGKGGSSIVSGGTSGFGKTIGDWVLVNQQ